jgi:hypothetical protein
MVYDIDTHQLNLRKFLIFKVFGWNFVKILFFCIYLTMNA